MVTNVSINFRRELLSILAERGIKQTELAKALGVSRSYITKLLKGEVKDKEELLNKIIKELDLEASRAIKLKIYAGIVPIEIAEPLTENDRLLEYLSKLGKSKLSEKEKNNLTEDLNAVASFLVRVLEKEEQKEPVAV